MNTTAVLSELTERVRRLARPVPKQSLDQHINATKILSFHINFAEIPAVFIHDSEYILHIKEASNQMAVSGIFTFVFGLKI